MTKKRLLSSFFALAFVAVGLLFSSPAHAVDWPTAVAQFIGNGVAVIVWILGRVLVIIIDLVVWVAQYNGFIKSSAVSQGWIIVRDVCNMFFIVILLIIAFGTVLNQEKYSWKHLLPKVLLAAVLINFSKLICGLLIDFAQVVMLSFVNGFRDIAGGNFANMAGIGKLLGINNESSEVTVLSLAGTYILALLYVVVSLVVMVVILFILIIRIVMIWILVVLSPLAYFLHAVPGKGETYAGKWWEQFTSYVVSGPILAFFIWLSFVALQPTDTTQKEPLGLPPPAKDKVINTISETASDKGAGTLAAGLSETGTPEGMLKFIVSVGMLIGGLMITSQLGGMAGSIAGAGMSKIQNGAKSLKKFGAKRAQVAGKFAGQTALRASGSLTQVVGNKISRETGGKFGESLQKSGAFLNSWGGDIRKTRKEAKIKKRKETLEALGMKEGTAEKLEAAADTKLGRSIKGAGAVVAGTAMMNPFGVGMVIGGVSHIATALGANWAGRKVKEKVVEWQNDTNVRQADRSLKDIDKKKDKEYEKALKNEPAAIEADKKIKEREDFRKEEIRQVDSELDENIRNAPDSPEQVQALKDSAEEEKERINIGVDMDIQRIKNDLTRELGDKPLAIKADIDAKYAPVIEETQKFRDQSTGALARDEGTKNLEREQKKALDDNQAARDREYDQVKQQFAAAPEQVREAKLKDVNDKFDAKKKDIKMDYDRQTAEHKNKAYEAGIKDTTLTWSRRPSGFLAQQTATYQPNRLTIEGAKELAKEIKEAATMVKNLATNGFKVLGVKDLSSAKGVDKKQEHFYGNLAKGDDWAKAAMAELVKEMQTLPATLSDTQKSVITSLKTGLAFYFKKKPGDKGAFKTLVDLLNNVDTGDKFGRKQVEQFGEDKLTPPKDDAPAAPSGGGSHEPH